MVYNFRSCDGGFSFTIFCVTCIELEIGSNLGTNTYLCLPNLFFGKLIVTARLYFQTATKKTHRLLPFAYSNNLANHPLCFKFSSTKEVIPT